MNKTDVTSQYKKPKIAHIIYGLNYGGAENLLILFSTKLKEKYEPIVIALYTGGPIEEKLKKEEIRVFVIRRDLRFNIFDFFKLINLLKKEKVDIIHTHLFLADFWGGLAARLLGKPHLSTLHGYPHAYERSEIFKTYKKLGFNFHKPLWSSQVFYLRQKIRSILPKIMIAVSEATKNDFLKYYPRINEKSQVIYNGILTEDFLNYEINKDKEKYALGFNKEDFIIGYIGRLSIEKGVFIGIKVVEILNKKYPNLKFLIIGGGEQKDIILNYIKKNGLENCIHLLGWQDDCRKFYKIFDIFMLPSFIEGCSISLLEAMASGCVCVAFDVGGNREIIENNQNGFLIPPFNIEKMASVIDNLISDRQKLYLLSMNTKDTVIRKFNYKDMLSKYEHIYRQLQKIKIAHVIYGLKIGGAENLLLQVCPRFDPNRFSVSVFALTYGGPLEEKLVRAGIKVKVIRRDGKFNFYNFIQLVNLIKKENIKILHTHLQNADILGGLAARVCRIKQISTYHRPPYKESFWEYVKQKLSTSLAYKIISVSQDAKDYCIKRLKTDAKKIRVIYNGVDIKRFEIKENKYNIRKEFDLNPEAFVISSIARLEEEKGHRYLIEAIYHISKLRPHFNLSTIIAGDGSLKGKLQEMVIKLNLKDKIKFLGARFDIPKVLFASDIMVLSSFIEGLPISCLEAMAVGVPVIATHIGGVKELIKDGKNGLLVEPGNALQLAEAILKLVDEPLLAKHLAEQARLDIMRDFTLENMIKNIEEIYESIM